MATTICPYCNIEVSEKEIEAEDGCCPECGAMLSAGSMYMDGDMDDYDPYEEPDFLDDDDDDLDREDAYLDDDVLSDIFDKFKSFFLFSANIFAIITQLRNKK